VRLLNDCVITNLPYYEIEKRPVLEWQIKEREKTIVQVPQQLDQERPAGWSDVQGSKLSAMLLRDDRDAKSYRYPGHVEPGRNADNSSRSKNEPIGLNRAYLAGDRDVHAQENRAPLTR
jgi:hypothetical protein